MSDTERCYRCFETFPKAELTPVTAACGCEKGYCSECLKKPGMVGFLDFVASRCVAVAEKSAA